MVLNVVGSNPTSHPKKSLIIKRLSRIFLFIWLSCFSGILTKTPRKRLIYILCFLFVSHLFQNCFSKKHRHNHTHQIDSSKQKSCKTTLHTLHHSPILEIQLNSYFNQKTPKHFDRNAEAFYLKRPDVLFLMEM